MIFFAAGFAVDLTGVFFTAAFFTGLETAFDGFFAVVLDLTADVFAAGFFVCLGAVFADLLFSALFFIYSPLNENCLLRRFF